ncbi:MAG: benzoate/H(+) symporter BenE family transporter [Bosea sp. (in: a-proteobacteria)]
MLRDLSWQAAIAGLLSAIVGFGSSFAIVVKGLTAAGASPAETSSGLMALSVAMGLCAILLSAMTRLPVSIAWSTPGAALLASGASAPGGFAGAVGAFLVCAVMIIIAASWKPLERLVTRIPSALSNAMLGGVLMTLCLAPAKALTVSPVPALAIIGTWFVVLMLKRLYAVPAAVAVTMGIIVWSLPPGALANAELVSVPRLILPEFSLAAIIGISLPLFLVTMASQNLAGIAVLQANGYAPEAGRLIRTTGFFSLFSAPFGGHAVNLAAITAALCASPEAGPDPAKRYWAAMVAGAFYVGFGLFAGAVIALVNAAPPMLIETVAGLALLGAFASAMAGAMADPSRREAAALTFLVAASGLSFGGIGGAFWGLAAGLLMLGATTLIARWRSP